MDYFTKITTMIATSVVPAASGFTRSAPIFS